MGAGVSRCGNERHCYYSQTSRWILSLANNHSVASSKWRDGKGDVLKDLSEACREFGLKMGISMSPWDRHEPSYGDSPRYSELLN